MNIIEPCCAERQIGQLLREHRGHAALFQTNGDVTLEKWMKAIMLMSGDRPRTLTIAVPVFTHKMMTAVAKYMRLEWVAKLRLMTTDPLPAEILTNMAARVYPDGVPAVSAADSVQSAGVPAVSAADSVQSAGVLASENPLLQRLDLAADPAVPSPLLMFQGTDGTVVIQGPMSDTIQPALCLYAGLFCGNQSTALRNATDAWEARFRARRVEMAAAPADGEGEADPVKSAAVPQQPKQPKKTTRKKTTTDEHTEEMA